MPKSSFTIDIQGSDGLRKAIKRNPEKVKVEIGKFIQRGLAEYRRGVINNPWRLGMQGGGAPVDTGNLRDTHKTNISPFRGYLEPTAKYGIYVHKGRPWLSFVFKDRMDKIKELEKDMLKEIVNDLAK